MELKSTKSKIVAAMYDLLAEQGYDKSSIGQIADKVGIKKASVYYYFRFKEEILMELVRYLYKTEDEFEFPTIKMKDRKTYQDYLISEGLYFINSFSDNPKARRVFAELDIQTSRIPKLKEFVAGYNLNIKEKWQKVLSFGMELKVFPENFDIKGNAEFIFTVLTGIDDAILYNYPVDTKRVWEICINDIIGKGDE